MYIYIWGLFFIPARFFPFRSSCASPLRALAPHAFQTLVGFWKGLLLNMFHNNTALRKGPEMVSGKVFRHGPVVEPDKEKSTHLLQFQSNDAVPEAAWSLRW